MKFVVVLVTVPYDKSKKIINLLLTKKLAACVNKIKTIESFYWWENKICNDKETLLVIKTKKILFEKIVKEIKKVHPYKVPEIISIEINNGNKEYLDWIKEVTI